MRTSGTPSRTAHRSQCRRCERAGKIKSIHGIYKKHGREAFLEAAAYYSDHVNPNSIDKTIDEMESRWYDATHRQTEAEKMVEDYNNGQTILNDSGIASTDTGQAMVM